MKASIQIISVLVIVFAIFILIIDSGDDSKDISSETTDNSQPQTSIEKNLTDEEKIENTILAAVDERTNTEKDTIRNIEIIETESGGHEVKVSFNAGDNLTKNMMRDGIESDMSEIYMSLYKENRFNVENVTVDAYFTLVDKYGNENEDIVYSSSLSKSEAEKVNWNAHSSSLKLNILPEIWKTNILHREFAN